MAEEEITIRPATGADAGAIAAILRDVGWFEHVNAEAPAETAARVSRGLALGQTGSSQTVLLAENAGGEVIGYGVVHWIPNLMLGLEGYISELFLRGADRGRGIGRQLLAAVKAEAAERGCERLMLLNRRSRESYQRAFYPKNGWLEREDIACFMLFL